MPELNSNCRDWLSQWDAELKGIVEEASLPTLGEGPKVPEIVTWINQHPAQIRQHPHGDLIASGLFLLAGELDRSHDLSQQDPSAEGSFLHAIMHRREGDLSNAKYWFRKVGDHPVLRDLAQGCPGYADPFDFVDACGREPDSGPLRDAAWLEWQHLMTWIASA